MPAYLISLCRDITDRKRLEDYWANVKPAFEGFEAKPLIAYAPFEILEGAGGILGVVLFECNGHGRMMNVFTRCEFEGMFYEIGLPISDSTAPPPHDPAPLVAKMPALAEKYGNTRTGDFKFPPPARKG